MLTRASLGSSVRQGGTPTMCMPSVLQEQACNVTLQTFCVPQAVRWIHRFPKIFDLKKGCDMILLRARGCEARCFPPALNLPSADLHFIVCAAENLMLRVSSFQELRCNDFNRFPFGHWHHVISKHALFWFTVRLLSYWLQTTSFQRPKSAFWLGFWHPSAKSSGLNLNSSSERTNPKNLSSIETNRRQHPLHWLSLIPQMPIHSKSPEGYAQTEQSTSARSKESIAQTSKQMIGWRSVSHANIAIQKFEIVPNIVETRTVLLCMQL